MHVKAPRTKWWKLKRQREHSRREFLMRALGMKEVMQIVCGWKWPKSSEWPKEASMKLKRQGGGIRRCKRLSKIRKSALGVYTWIW
jgi:hypothetical protein